MFQFTGCPLLTLWIHVRIPAVFTGGFPHSEISGSQPVCGSPKLIAAYHVFHRLSVPRHPPCALLCLTFCTVHRMINHSVCCILIINNLAWLFMITIVCRSFDQRPIIALVNNNLIFALTSKINLVVSMFACFCIRFSRYQIHCFAMDSKLAAQTSSCRPMSVFRLSSVIRNQNFRFDLSSLMKVNNNKCLASTYPPMQSPA